MKEPFWDWWEVKHWPLMWRRAFLLTLPLSIPIYVLVWCLWFVIALCIVLPTSLIVSFGIYAHEEWWTEKHNEKLR